MKFKKKFFKKYMAIIFFLNDNLQKFLIKISFGKKIPLNRPTSIIIDVTENCILRCKQCHLWKTKPSAQITYDEGKIIIDNLYDWLGNFYLFFTGGEPLLNKDLIKIIGYAEKKGIVTHVNSNAFLIDKKMAKDITKSGLSSLSISLDGSNAKTHDYLRGVNGTFDHAIMAIDFLKKQNKKIKIFINTVIMKRNISELKEIIKLSVDKKINGVTFQCLLPTLATKQGFKQFTKSSLWPNFKKVKENILEVKGMKNLLNSDKNLKQIIDYYSISKKMENIKCTAGINNFIVNRKGEVRLCFAFPAIGNIFNDKPKDIWVSEMAQKQRKDISQCKRMCKIIACNKVETKRQKEVMFRPFE